MAHAPQSVKSMTGFSAVTCDVPGGRVAIELKSVNHRYLEFQTRMPEEIRSLEGVMRDKLAAALTRGKVDCRVTLTNDVTQAASTPSTTTLAALRATQVDILAAFDARPLSVWEIMHAPGVMAKKATTLRAIYPNAGVENWYRQQLQRVVTAMSTDILAELQAVWHDADVDIGFAKDAAPLLAAGIMFRNPDGRVLLLRRTDGEGWAFPAGGVEYGETPEMCARREAGEETGWGMGDPLTPLDVRVLRGVRFSTFLVDCDGFVPVLNHEHDNHSWALPEHALQMMNLHPGGTA